MIAKITNDSLYNLAKKLDKFLLLKNRTSEYLLNSSWTKNTLIRLERGEIQGLYYQDNNSYLGFLIYQVGKQSVFVSSLYIQPDKHYQLVLHDLIKALKEIHTHKTILFTNAAPGISVRSQSDIFCEIGFERLDRYRMEYYGEPPGRKVCKPSGVRLRKFNPDFGAKLDRLDAMAYRNQPDGVIMSVFRDILGEYPSLRLAKAGKSLFDSKLSNFAFIGDRLVGAIYCARGRNLVGIANIAVDPKYQKMGIGSLLLDRTLRGIKKGLYGGCALNVSKENTIAYNFYKKIGFKLKRFCPNFVYRLGRGVNTSAK